MLDGYFKKSTIKLSFSVGTMKKKAAYHSIENVL